MKNPQDQIKVLGIFRFMTQRKTVSKTPPYPFNPPTLPAI